RQQPSRLVAPRPTQVNNRPAATEGDNADRELRRGATIPPPADPHRTPAPDSGPEERAATPQLEGRAKTRERPDRDGFLADDRRARSEPDRIGDHDPRGDDIRTVAELDVVTDDGPVLAQLLHL